MKKRKILWDRQSQGRHYGMDEVGEDITEWMELRKTLQDEWELGKTLPDG